ncbi:MAG: hypothetical protein EA358_01425 [Flavobacteriales bacterium]|nr:MAG: hypothetical protein EA358_01425 [Flavobacteriales bacterium]
MLTKTAFDALNRPTLITQPDGSQHRPAYNDAPPHPKQNQNKPF